MTERLLGCHSSPFNQMRLQRLSRAIHGCFYAQALVTVTVQSDEVTNFQRLWRCEGTGYPYYTEIRRQSFFLVQRRRKHAYSRSLRTTEIPTFHLLEITGGQLQHIFGVYIPIPPLIITMKDGSLTFGGINNGSHVLINSGTTDARGLFHARYTENLYCGTAPYYLATGAILLQGCFRRGKLFTRCRKKGVVLANDDVHGLTSEHAVPRV
ncbi:uncharacterized protein F5891DRAFT_1803 [Suillus fuscotomentosus]|uniref:Uncharacterized protein n=1 Tax=Suillus fuscotomentosus TaxID=1912939 RepID=A0AAD4EL08_9AGAM|nr:uncharacterized protein F5891DRAFT_1803 [Suillus fuscotomentosus]KAG1908140.1 hypothetical protein F5891DRAFT_1803 [Suillus fuscotomentosus]